MVATDRFLLLGDFNYHIELPQDPNTEALLANLQSLGLDLIVHSPTHVAGHTLDPIFTNSSLIKFEFSTQVTWSDHFVLTFSLDSNPRPEKCKQRLMWLDSRLSFEYHTRRVTGVCFGILRGLRKTLDLLPTTARQTLVHALVTSRLDYGNALYLGANAGCIARLQRIQNAAARLVLMLPKRASSKKALNTLHWLPIRERVLFKTLCISHRITQGRGPSYLHKLLAQQNIPRQLRSSGTGQVKIPNIKKARMGGRSFRFLAAQRWNKLPQRLRLETSETAFRKELKTFLFPVN